MKIQFVIVSVDKLACLDSLIWFGKGERAARRLQIAQSTICRTSRRVAEQFDLELAKDLQGEWSLHGDQRLLNLERSVHQEYRLSRNRLLRLEAQYYSGPFYSDSLGDNYLLGYFDFLDVASPLSLLRSGVIDAWIACYPDVPDRDDPVITSFPLTRLPARLVASPLHPLLRKTSRVTLDDVVQYPSLALAEGAFPEVQRILESIGLWNTQARTGRYQRSKWEGQTADQVTIGYATSFTLDKFAERMVPLPVEIPLIVGDELLVKRCHMNHPRIRRLLSDLQGRAVDLSNQYDDVTLAF